MLDFVSWVDNSSIMHVHKMKKINLSLVKGPKQLLDDTKTNEEAKYSGDFTRSKGISC